MIEVDPSSGVPVFRQIMDQVRLLIAGGALCGGDRLPATRSLATDLGVNPMTVSKAYNLLERDGVVERRPGRPLVVRSVSESELAERRLSILTDRLDEVVKLVDQLGIDSTEAADLFSSLLSGRSKEPKP